MIFQGCGGNIFINFMFKNGEVFNPGDLYKMDLPSHLKDKQEERAIR